MGARPGGPRSSPDLIGHLGHVPGIPVRPESGIPPLRNRSAHSLTGPSTTRRRANLPPPSGARRPKASFRCRILRLYGCRARTSGEIGVEGEGRTRIGPASSQTQRRLIRSPEPGRIARHVVAGRSGFPARIIHGTSPGDDPRGSGGRLAAMSAPGPRDPGPLEWIFPEGSPARRRSGPSL